MRRVYTLLLYLLLPLGLLRLLWRSRRVPEYRRRWRERLGRVQPPPAGGLWLHAVSVGEVQAAAPLLKLWRQLHPELPRTVTTTTPTGSRRVAELFGDEVFHSYIPYDTPRFVSRFLDAVRPVLVVIMETEIWPNLIALCAERGIPCVLANARLSARSAVGYARLPQLTRKTLRGFALIAAQARQDAERFLRLGADGSRVQVTGNLKFDIRLPASLEAQAQALRREWDQDRRVWVGASTHEGEEEWLLQVQARLLELIPDCLLVLVPRHPERFEQVAQVIAKKGFAMARRSEHRPCAPATQVYLGDSMGELPMFLAAGDVAFVGGSLVPQGGHNLLEAAALGKPVVFGPHVFNFSEISRLVLDAEAGRQVVDADELFTVLRGWLLDASERARIGENGRLVVERNKGAMERLAARIEPLLRGGA